MEINKERMSESREVLLSIVNGINPVSGKEIKRDSMLLESKIMEALVYTTSLMKDLQNSNYLSYKPAVFVMNEEQKSKVNFGTGTIGVMEFSKNVNDQLDLAQSRKLTGVDLNRRLRKLGIISEEQLANGKKRAAINDSSEKYGFCSEKREFHGTEYEMVVMNNDGKKYLMENIDTIMGMEV